MASAEPFAKLSWMLTLASIAVVTGALYLAKGVLVPLTLAVLLSFLLSPICDRLERWRVGRIPAVVVTAMLAFTLLGRRGMDGRGPNDQPRPQNCLSTRIISKRSSIQRMTMSAHC